MKGWGVERLDQLRDLPRSTGQVSCERWVLMVKMDVLDVVTEEKKDTNNDGVHLIISYGR